MQGVSLLPATVDQSLQRDTPLFWEHEGNRAIRDGRWKLVARGPQGAWELYDMAADRTETNNLATDHPDRVASMASQWDAWAKAAKVKPWPWTSD